MSDLLKRTRISTRCLPFVVAPLQARVQQWTLILTVDDDPLLYRFFQVIIDLSRDQIHAASTTEEAIRMALGLSPLLLLLFRHLTYTPRWDSQICIKALRVIVGHTHGHFSLRVLFLVQVRINMPKVPLSNGQHQKNK